MKNLCYICIAMVTIMMSLRKTTGRDSLHYPFISRDCQNETCSSTEFNCNCNQYNRPVVNSCIPLTKVCDGWEDCSDGSDEFDCKCPTHFMQCNCDHGGGCSGSKDLYYCIAPQKVCDGEFDCPNYADELSCNVSSYFWCSDGYYVTGELCNGVIICNDDETNCSSCPNERPNRCACNKPGNMSCDVRFSQSCFSEQERCDGRAQCSDMSDEWNCTCPRFDRLPWLKYFQCACSQHRNFSCSTRRICIEPQNVCDGINNCGDSSDEMNCSKCPDQLPNRCLCNKLGKSTCSGMYSCYSGAETCDGINNCGDFSDELNCTECPLNLPHRCACNQPGNFTCKGKYSCFSYSDTRSSCSDGSHLGKPPDVAHCLSSQYECSCHKTDRCEGSKGCISSGKLYDGKPDCPDGSDESIHRRRIRCGRCVVDVRRLTNFDQCNKIDFPECDNSTCFTTPSLNCSSFECDVTNVICTSFCDDKICNKVFLCDDGSPQLLHNYCNGDERVSCPDQSDEIRDKIGFRCPNWRSNCVLPQRNLYDDVAQCKSGSDLCNEDGKCFTCLDKLLVISASQVCDSVIDCYDLSDECLCDNSFYLPVCTSMFLTNNAFTSQCTEVNRNCQNLTEVHIEKARCRADGEFQTTFSSSNYSSPSPCTTRNQADIIPVLCDGRPECRDLSDECNCSNIPSFCNDPCHNFFPLGDRYCDGVVDPSWKFINDPRCPEGFDELNCSKRFNCLSRGRISIDVSMVCDGVINCDDGSDEESCSHQRGFSSDTEMIKSQSLRIALWVMAIAALILNGYAIFSTAKELTNESLSVIGDVIILCLFLSNFLMGAYLLIISIKSSTYSGDYITFDLEWRTSLLCDISGSLAFFAVVANCFFAAFSANIQFYQVFKTSTFSQSSRRIIMTCIGLAWLLALFIALTPFLPVASSYFIRGLWFSNIFFKSTELNRAKAEAFACRLASLTGTAMVGQDTAWTSAKYFLSNKFPEYSSKGEVGYYGDTSLCLPRIFIHHGDSAWGFTLAVVTTITLLHLASAIVCVISYKLQSRFDERDDTKQRIRIFRFIVTDATLWLTLCIITYITLAGVTLTKGNDVVVSLVLLTTFCIFNPLLYLPFYDVIASYVKNKISSEKRTDETALQDLHAN